MLSFEIIQAIAELRRTVRRDSYLFTVLSELSSHHIELVDRLGKILPQGGQQEAWAQVQNSLLEIREITNLVKAIRHRALFTELSQMEAAISAFQGVAGTDEFVTEILPVIDKFSSTYEKFLSGYSYASGLEFVISWNYTREGKIEAIPKRIEVINEVLGLRSRLAAEGVDTVQMEEEIVKCGIKISEQLNSLLGDQGVITLNGETYSVGEQVEKKYIEESRHLLLDAPRNDETSAQ